MTRSGSVGMGLALACAHFAGLWLMPLSAVGQTEPLPAPDTPGSHVAYLESLTNAEGVAFAELLERYESHQRRAPDSVAAAVERCAFIAGSIREDGNYDDRWELEAACVVDLEERFPTDPEATIYRLGRQWGPEGIALGERVLSEFAPDWSPLDRGRARLVLAQILAFSDQERAAQEAIAAMEDNPELDGSLIVARQLIAEGRDAQAATVLNSRLLDVDSRDSLLMKAHLLADLERYESAERALRTLQDESYPYLDELLHARVLEGLGRTDEARKIYLAHTDGYSRAQALTRLFELDLERAAYDSAFESYQSFRDEGYENDPFLRDRIRLALGYPSAPWAWRDLLGALALLALILGCALFPVFWIVPVHYAGLIRRVRGYEVPSNPRWTLRLAWLASGVLVVVDTLCLLAYVPNEVGGWFLNYTPATVLDSAALARFGVVSSLLGFLLIVAFLRRADLQFVLRGPWGLQTTAEQVGKSFVILLVVGTINYSVATALGYAEEATTADPSLAVGFVQLMLKAILEDYGLLALLGTATVLIPITEEIVFRYILFGAFKTHVPVGWANAAQAALFALAHEDLAFFPLFFVFGLLAGELRLDSRSLLPSILLHGSWNLLVCLRLAAFYL